MLSINKLSAVAIFFFVASLPCHLLSQDRESALLQGEFLSLPIEAQRAYVGTKLAERNNAMHNLHVKFTMHSMLSKNVNGNAGSTIKALGSTKYELWRIGGSYRLLSEHTEGKASLPLYTAQSAFDSKDGIGNMLAEHQQQKKPTARIDKRHDPVVSKCLYLYLLSGHIDEFRNSYQLTLEKNIAATAFSKGQDNDAAVIATYTESFPDKATTEWRVELDLSHGMSIRKLEKYWSRQTTGGLAFEKTNVEVTEEFDLERVWIPRKVRILAQSQHSLETLGVYEINVSEAKIGVVEPQELAISYPKGTEVNNMISGVQYVEGGGGLQIGGSGAAKGTLTPAPNSSSFSMVWIWVGGLSGLIAVVLLFFALKSRR